MRVSTCLIMEFWVCVTQQVIFVVFTPALLFASLVQSVTFEDLISWYVILLISSALVARRVSFFLRLFVILIKLFFCRAVREQSSRGG